MGSLTPIRPELTNWAPFNSPLECGLRALVILVEAHPSTCDLQRLVYYDYLLVHSEDAGGPNSLHPATPNRSGELLVRREVLERGLFLFLSRGLVERHFSERGIGFAASETSQPFLQSLTTAYTASLRERGEWVISSFGDYSDEALAEYFRTRIDQWGAEFESESLFRDVPA
jgi:hypothetical protein